MTEQEAKEKLCPLNAIATVIEKSGGIKYDASACMMWRWTVSPAQLKDVTYVVGDKKLLEAGYCGLAGKL
jgi:hypothetical protein